MNSNGFTCMSTCPSADTMLKGISSSMPSFILSVWVVPWSDGCKPLWALLRVGMVEACSIYSCCSSDNELTGAVGKAAPAQEKEISMGEGSIWPWSSMSCGLMPIPDEQAGAGAGMPSCSISSCAPRSASPMLVSRNILHIRGGGARTSTVAPEQLPCFWLRLYSSQYDTNRSPVEAVGKLGIRNLGKYTTPSLELHFIEHTVV